MTPRPYPHIPPEIVPPLRPERPQVHPPIPTVWMPEGGDARPPIYDKLLARRTIFVERPLDSEAASLVAAQLMALDSDEDGDSGRPVTVVVNSPGGPLDAVSAVLDTVDLMRCPVDTTCIGQALGTAAVVVAAGTGRRRAGATAQFRLRLPDVELAGDTARLDQEVAQHQHLQAVLVDRLVTTTGQERRRLERDIERGRALTAEEAADYGLVDEVAGRNRSTG